MPSERIEPLNNSIQSSTPCELCGEPASWISGDGTDEGTMVLCDRCHELEDQQ